MRRLSIALSSCAAIALFWVGLGVTQIASGNAQINPNFRAGQRAIALSKFLQLRQIGKFQIAQAPEFLSLCDSDNQLVGAARNSLSIIGEDGKIVRSFQTTIQKPSVSNHTAGVVIIGDCGAKSVFTMDLKTGKVTPMFSLSAVQDPPRGQFPNGELMRSGEMLSVASNGKEAFVAFGAGFSSAIFRIDPASKRVVGRAWATAEDPTAMTVHRGGLYVLTSGGKQVRKFTETLQLSHDKIDLEVVNSKGLAIRGEELRVLTDSGRSITRFRINPGELTSVALRANLDLVRSSSLIRKDIGRITMNFASRYAVLICGDLAENFAGECFWNDTVWMYKTLLANGYTKQNIYVLYGDGADYASANPKYQHSSTVTDFAATPANVNMALDGLKNGDGTNGIAKMDDNDTLFLWTFDHGSTAGGVAYLCLRGGSLSATSMNAKLNAISYERRAIFMQQCYAGGFIPGLKNAKTFISTACKSNETAHPADTENEMVGGKTYSHGEYNYYVTCALNRLSQTGGLVNADSNSDNWIASKEMHNWFVDKENRSETPQMDDSGGIGGVFRFKK